MYPWAVSCPANNKAAHKWQRLHDCDKLILFIGRTHYLIFGRSKSPVRREIFVFLIPLFYHKFVVRSTERKSPCTTGFVRATIKPIPVAFLIFAPCQELSPTPSASSSNPPSEPHFMTAWALSSYSCCLGQFSAWDRSKDNIEA